MQCPNEDEFLGDKKMRTKSMRSIMLFAILSVLAVGLVALSGCKKSKTSTTPTSTVPKAADVTAAVTEQSVCPIMGRPINKNIYSVYNGKKVYFCCQGCVTKFEVEPEKYLDKLPQLKR